MIKVNRKIFKILYRLTLPGSLLLVFSALLIRVGVLADPQSPIVRFLPAVVFAVGLALSAFFRRSRLFFALLALTLAQSAFAWVIPHLSAGSTRITANAIAILLPLNLLVLAFLRERGIISPAGRRRLAIAALQVMGVAILCMPATANIAAQLGRAFVPAIFSRWSGLSQAALLAFILATAIIMVPLVRRYKAVESSLLWSLVAAFIALREAGMSHLDGVYFAAAGLALIVALIETSYAMAYLDELTQLPSRRALNEALLKLGDAYSIAMLDVDHFKKFNDDFGHEAGDSVLRQVAEILTHTMRGEDIICRYGGEEFVAILPDVSFEAALERAQHLRRIVSETRPLFRNDDRRGITVSIGVAMYPQHAETTETLLRAADRALYEAKHQGRNRIVAARQATLDTSVAVARS